MGIRGTFFGFDASDIAVMMKSSAMCCVSRRLVMQLIVLYAQRWHWWWVSERLRIFAVLGHQVPKF
jgi:hypothetical protein